jgi:hypothetical protein
MFLQLSYLNCFDQFDLQSGQIVRTVKLPVSGPGAQMQPQNYPNQAAHHGIALSPDGNYVCDAATISNYVALVSRPALTLSAVIPVGDQPAEAETSLDGHYCFVTNRGPGQNANTVSVISYAQRREVARIPVGQHPQEEGEAMMPDSVLRAGGYLRAGSPGAPRLIAVGMTHRRFKIGRGGSPRVPRGTAFEFTLSRDARVTIALQRLEPGRRVGRACRPSARALLAHPRCTRVLARGTLAVSAHAGPTTLPFSGRLHRRRLAAGRYRARLRARAIDGLRSREVTVAFTVAPG